MTYEKMIKEVDGFIEETSKIFHIEDKEDVLYEISDQISFARKVSLLTPQVARISKTFYGDIVDVTITTIALSTSHTLLIEIDSESNHLTKEWAVDIC